MCTYYHATNLNYTVGQTISINDFEGDVTYNHNNRPKQEQSVNIILDAARPRDVISRLKCIYLFNDVEVCKAYARSNTIQHIYSVYVNNAVWGPYPMTLLTTLYNSNDENRNNIITEYWYPTQQWQVNEFLVSSMIIMNIIELGNGGRNIEPYVNDRQLSRKLYQQ